jgi:hypothetical protein
VEVDVEVRIKIKNEVNCALGIGGVRTVDNSLSVSGKMSIYLYLSGDTILDNRKTFGKFVCKR